MGDSSSESPPPLPFFTARQPLPPAGVPSLSTLALDALAANPDLIYDLRGTAEHLAVALLFRIMQAGRLDYRLACVFRDAGHAPITEAINGTDPLAGIPTHNALNSAKGCRY